MLSFENITFKLNIRRKPNKIIRKKKGRKEKSGCGPYLYFANSSKPPTNQ